MPVARRALFGHHDLPYLDVSGAKGAGTGEQVVFPHSLERSVIFFSEAMPCLLEAVVPGQEGFFVVRGQIMDVLNHKETFCVFGDLGDTGQHPVGENIPIDPGITVYPGNIATDSVEQKYPFIFQATVDDLHEGTVVFLPYVFEHADGNDLVEASPSLPVILMADVHGQVFAEFTGMPDLFPRDIDSRYGAAVSFGGVAREAAPAAADIQDMILRLEIDFPADKFQLFRWASARSSVP